MVKSVFISLAIVCLLGYAVASEAPQLSAQDLANVELMTTINNYFGCKTWKDGVCVQCSARYYFNKKGVCCQVKPECKNFNVAEGICEACYQGYAIQNGVCVLSDAVNGVDRGCKAWRDGVCTQCSARWYFGPNNVCYPVDDLCRTWNQQSGACESCYPGYALQAEKCVVDPTYLAAGNDPLCALWNDGKCTKCAERAYFYNGACQQVSNDCQSWDNYDGKCLACYKGYNLNNGACVLAQQQQPTDVGCKVWDWDNKKCTQCSFRYVFSAGVCVPVDNLCQTFDNNGACLTCYRGYEVKDGKCVYCQLQRPQDLGCKTWDWEKQICYECSFNFYYKQGQGCVPVDNTCKGVNEDGVCTACYKGYNLNNGACVLADQKGPTDLGCKTWDWDNQKCLECSYRWVFNQQGVCQQVSDSCSAWEAYGACTACYKGYYLNNGACVLADQKGPTDLGCKTWDWDNQKCLECSYRWVFNQQGVCQQVQDYCSTWGADGACTACYKGYYLNNGACVLSDQKGPTDLGCKTWDWDNQKCLECSYRWVFNQQGVCQQVSDSCSAWEAYGACTACYKGYYLNNGACVLADQKGPTDLGCKTWNWDNQKCLECSYRWVFNQQGVCQQVSDSCSAWEAYGACTACYKGYYLNNGACVLADQKGPTDLGCKTWNWDNQKCLECSYRWVFNQQGVCQQVQDYCSTWGADGACTACYKGYYLNNGACVLADQKGPTDLGCKTWDWDNQKCLECSYRWAFNQQGVCQQISDYCSTWGADGACTACYKGYYLNNGACVLSDQKGPTDLGCKTWDWDNQKCLECSYRWVFNQQGVCQQVSDSCSAWEAYGACTACYKGYYLNNGACVLADQKGPTDLGCKTWDWDNQKCLECSYRWAFNQQGVCQQISDYCSTWGEYGVCTACYKGYNLNNGACVLADQKGPTDLGCKTWDWDNQKCLECSYRWVFNQQGVCQQVSDSCSAWEAYGACTACYKGYYLNNGACVLADQKGPTDLGCKTWDWDNQKCLECSYRWVFNQQGVCQQVSDSCSAWEAYGACTACYPGYALNNGACQVLNVVCKTGANGQCQSCYTGYVLLRKQCVPISKVASLYQYYAECCPQKLAALKRDKRLM